MTDQDERLAKVIEDIIDPDREIVDPHHHLWHQPNWTYGLDELWADTDTGHRVVQTVFVECRSSYLADGPDHLRPIGETRYVAEIAATSKVDAKRATIAAIVGHADLTHTQLDDVLDAHELAGKGLFRGIRHSGARDPHPEALSIPGRSIEGLYANESFRRG